MGSIFFIHTHILYILFFRIHIHFFLSYCKRIEIFKNDIRLLTCNNLYICHDDYFLVPDLTLPMNTRLCLAFRSLRKRSSAICNISHRCRSAKNDGETYQDIRIIMLTCSKRWEKKA